MNAKVWVRWVLSFLCVHLLERRQSFRVWFKGDEVLVGAKSKAWLGSEDVVFNDVGVGCYFKNESRLEGICFSLNNVVWLKIPWCGDCCQLKVIGWAEAVWKRDSGVKCAVGKACCRSYLSGKVTDSHWLKLFHFNCKSRTYRIVLDKENYKCWNNCRGG